MLLALIEVIVAIIIGVVVMSQIVIPMWNGAKLFPTLRRQGSLEAALHDVQQECTEAELEERLNEAKQSLERKAHAKTKE